MEKVLLIEKMHRTHFMDTVAEDEENKNIEIRQSHQAPVFLYNFITFVLHVSSLFKNFYSFTANVTRTI